MPQPVHVTFVHGLANKPPKDDLRRIWLDALAEPFKGGAGFDLEAEGVTVSFVYWADLFHDEPLSAAGYESYMDELAHSVSGDVVLADDRWTRDMLATFQEEDEDAHLDPPTDEPIDGYERIPIPWFLKKKLMRRFVKEAHDYLFNIDGLRDNIRGMVVDDLHALPEDARVVLVGHSQGSFIAYDALTCDPNCRTVDGLLTLGSPLGVDEIQDKLVWTRDDGFPGKLRGDWVNVYDPYDAVARPDPKLAHDFRKSGQKVVIDVMEANWGRWRHSATKYVKGPLFRHHLRRLCNREDAP